MRIVLDTRFSAAFGTNTSQYTRALSSMPAVASRHNAVSITYTERGNEGPATISVAAHATADAVIFAATKRYRSNRPTNRHVFAWTRNARQARPFTRM